MIPGLNMDPRQMKMLARQFGVNLKTEEIPAKRVIFDLGDRKMVIENPSVTAMEIQGQKTYTVTGTINEDAGETEIPKEDIEMVSGQTGKSKKEAEKALNESKGDIAEAIAKLKR